MALLENLEGDPLIRLLLLFSIAIVGYSQAVFTVSKTTALSGSAEVITVQQPATTGKVVRGIGAYMDSTAACSITIERNGTAATTTTLVPANLNTDQPVATTTAYSASNVGTGTVVSRATVGAGGWLFIDLSRLYMLPGAGTGTNFTLRTGSCTATVNIILTYTENNT